MPLQFVFGLRSLSFETLSYNPNLERTVRGSRNCPNFTTLETEPVTVTLEYEIDRPTLLRDHYVPSTYMSLSCIQLPQITVTHYEIKPSTIQMLPTFYGLSNEDPYKHLDEFLEIGSTLKIQHVTEDALRMRLFPFSLKEKAKHWLNSLEPNTITSWAQL